MAVGEIFTASQQRHVEQTLATAMRETGLHLSVFVGDVEGASRDVAEQLHAALGSLAPRAVLLLVAPGARQLELVTGQAARERVSDRTCALATLSMTTAFAGGDLAGGIVTGVRMLADAAGLDPQR